MKIAFVSTYPPKSCGIATYLAPLARAVAEQPGVERVTVLSECSGKAVDARVEVRPCFRPNADFVGPLMQAVQDIRPDLVHLQHTPDILGMDRRMLNLLDELGRAGVRRVVTPHTVYDFRSGLIERKPGAPRFNRRFGARCDAVIAHQPGMIDTLVHQGVARSKVHLLPHWTGPALTGDGGGLRRRLGLSEKHKLLLFFGFIHVQKSVHTPILALRRVLESLPEARLVIAGSIAGGTWYNRLYNRYLEGLVRRNGLQECVRFDQRFIPDADMEAYYSTADLILLPHAQGYGSASGVAHQALAARKPLLCSAAPKFEEIAHSISRDLIVPDSRPQSWADAIVALLRRGTDQALLDVVARYADETSITATAANHVRIYRDLLGA